MLREEDKKEIKERLNDMTGSVTLKLFTQQVAGTCQFCAEAEKLLKEVVELSDKLELQIKNFVMDEEDVKTYGIDKIPAIVIEGAQDVGLRYYGLPTGYEFATLLDTILRVSAEDDGLSDELKKKLAVLKEDVHIQVFVTPTCPYCPKAALTAYQIAMVSDKVKADVIEVTEFPHIGQKYNVMGVPKTVINEDKGFEGALSENDFVEHVLTT